MSIYSTHRIKSRLVSMVKSGNKLSQRWQPCSCCMPAHIYKAAVTIYYSLWLDTTTTYGWLHCRRRRRRPRWEICGVLLAHSYGINHCILLLFFCVLLLLLLLLVSLLLARRAPSVAAASVRDRLRAQSIQITREQTGSGMVHYMRIIHRLCV